MAARYRVHLAVRYEVAADFVREYVENLSRGGLFVRGGRGLQRRRDVEVDIDLPGLGSYRVHAEVMHVIAADEAAALGRAPGAGLRIVGAPEGFAEAMASYLTRLGRRGDATVVCTADDTARAIAAAGYKVSRCASAAALSAKVAADERILAVVAPGAEVTALCAAAPGVAVVPMDGSRELDRVLGALDARL